MTNSAREPERSWKALGVFKTLRANLALADSFVRMSHIDGSSGGSPENLGFLHVEPGEEQWRVHNSSVTVIAAALLSQALQNYFEMSRLKPGLASPEVESFLNELDGREDFVAGFQVVRNQTFHISALDREKRDALTALGNSHASRGAPHHVIRELLDLLYDYTEACFLGDLRIFPDQQYEDLERRKQQDPQWAERWERGELTLEDLSLAPVPGDDGV